MLDVSASTLLSTILLSKKIQAFLGRYPLADKTALETDKAGERNAPKTADINTALIVSVGDSAREADDFSVLAIRAWAEIGVGHEAIISTSVKHRGQRIGGAEGHRRFPASPVVGGRDQRRVTRSGDLSPRRNCLAGYRRGQKTLVIGGCYLPHNGSIC